MRKFVYFFGFLIFLSSCEGEINQDVESILSQKISIDEGIGNIDYAERKVGKLLRKKVTLKDSKTGSELEIIIGAKSSTTIDKFLLDNIIKFTGIDQFEKDRIKNSFSINNGIVNSKDKLKSDEIFVDDDQIYYDLVSKKLRGGAVGYSFSIIPKNINSTRNAKTSSLSWRQQTSLPWCEWATIVTVNENSPTEYFLYSQQRGVFWNGSGHPIGIIRTDGRTYDIPIDGPKFTRFGGYDPVTSKFYVIWYDLESNSQVFGTL